MMYFSSSAGEISAKLFISGFAEKYRASGRNIEKKHHPNRLLGHLWKVKSSGILHRSLAVI